MVSAAEGDSGRGVSVGASTGRAMNVGSDSDEEPVNRCRNPTEEIARAQEGETLTIWSKTPTRNPTHPSSAFQAWAAAILFSTSAPESSAMEIGSDEAREERERERGGDREKRKRYKGSGEVGPSDAEYKGIHGNSPAITGGEEASEWWRAREVGPFGHCGPVADFLFLFPL